MTQTTATRASRRDWIGLSVLALPCLLISMDLTVLNLAVPSLSADLRPSAAQLLWIVDVYGFLIAGSLITMGALGDRIGRRRLLLIGAAAFGIASVLAAFATSTELLIAARAVLGIAGATLMPSTLSLIRNMFLDPGQRTVAIGIWTTSFSVGGMIAPLVGGLLLEHFWWGSVFLVNVPIMLLLLVIGPLLLPEFRDPDPGQFDLISAALSLVAILAAIYGIKRIAEDGAGWVPVISIGVGLAIGAVFVRRQRGHTDPLIDPRLFQLQAFRGALAMNVLSFFVLFGTSLFIAQYLQLVLGLSPLQAGLWTMPSSGAFILGTMLVPLLARRTRPATMVAGGLVVAAIGFALFTQIDDGNGLAFVVAGSVVFALGLPAVFILATDLAVGSAPPERAGAASAISETSVELGGALGIAILGSIGTAVYRRQMADNVPAGVPLDAAEAARATLGGAVAVAERLPDQLAAALLGPAREAFTQSLIAVGAISAAIVLVGAVVALVLLRQVPAGSGAPLETRPGETARSSPEPTDR